jgi:hypothetical protein
MSPGFAARIALSHRCPVRKGGLSWWRRLDRPEFVMLRRVREVFQKGIFSKSLNYIYGIIRQIVATAWRSGTK